MQTTFIDHFNVLVVQVEQLVLYESIFVCLS